MNKRGLSMIITTLILIVLVLVAVAIIWVVVNNILKGGTEGIALGKFTLDAGIKNVNIDNSSNNVSLTVKRNPGKGELSGMKFIFYDGVNSEIITEEDMTLKELGSRRFNFHLINLNVDNLIRISIVPIFKSESGKEIMGNIIDVCEVEGGEGGEEETPCTPTTCSDLNYECGSWPNGTCAGTLNCGTCGLHTTCPSGTCVCDSGWGDCNNDNSCDCDLSLNSCVGGNCVVLTLDLIIPFDRRIDWNPGIPGGIPNYPVGVDVTDYGANGSDGDDDTAEFNNAISACNAGQAVYIPSGTYYLSSTLTITKEIALRGDGPNNTKLIYTGGSGNIITFSVWGEDSVINMISGYTKNSTSLTLASTSGLAVDDYVLFYQDNEEGLVYNQGYGAVCTWCGVNDDENHCMSQFAKITAIDGNIITINHPLHYTFTSGNYPEIREWTMLEGGGVEDLYLEMQNPASIGILLSHCAGCWIKNIESYNMGSRHIRLHESHSCEIRDNYIHHAPSYGSNAGVGIEIMGPNSDHLIENNIIYFVRHSITFQGGSGCVIAYNYAQDPQNVPESWMGDDMITHGCHPYMNLWEGNICTNFKFDWTWGSSSHNTMFRNYARRNRDNPLATSGVNALDIQYGNYYYNIVGNVFCEDGDCSGNGGPETDCYLYNNYQVYRFGCEMPNCGTPTACLHDSNVLDTMIFHGNYDYYGGSTQWDPAIPDHNLPDSYYLTSKPAFFGSLPWPSIGSDLTSMVNDIPAKIRFDAMGI